MKTLSIAPLLLLSSPLVVSGAPHPASSVGYSALDHVLEALSHPPLGWVEEKKASSRPSPDSPLRLRIHLKQPNFDLFEKKLLKISTPGDDEYGAHMSQKAIKNMLRPSSETLERTQAWLNENGLGQRVKLESSWIYVDTTLGKAEELLKAQYRTYRDEFTGELKTRTLEYSIPASLKGHIDTIHPTVMFGRTEAMRSTIKYSEPAPHQGFVAQNSFAPAAVNASCNTSITPDCLRELYEFNDYKPTESKSLLGIAGFLEQWPQYDDTEQFLTKYDPSNAAANFSCILVNGGTCNQTNNSGDAGEANLDIEYAVAIDAPLPINYYSTGGRPPIVGNPSVNDNEPYFEFLNYILSLDDEDLPRTISISYGEGEKSVPPSYASTVCNLFAQAGARGVSILSSSGDSGPGGSCLDPVSNTTRFSALFPAGCPYVTAVGATVGISPERTTTFSGGGFSDYFARPAYQDAAVQAYFDAGNSANQTQYFNASGRGLPDIAAQGQSFHVLLAGRDVLESGTSASAPVFASIINLLNNELIVAGKKPLGFLNPWIYAQAKDTWTDITAGKTTGCTARVPGAGFPAVAGWDPATGLGTPLLSKLLPLVREGY